MAFTYDSLIGTDTDRIRLLIGDVTVSEALLQDEEIAFFLTAESNVVAAAAAAAEAIAAQFARLVQVSHGGDDTYLQQQFDHYTALAERLRDQSTTSAIAVSATGFPALYAGGLSVIGRTVYDPYSDVTEPLFQRDDP